MTPAPVLPDAAYVARLARCPRRRGADLRTACAPVTMGPVYLCSDACDDRLAARAGRVRLTALGARRDASTLALAPVSRPTPRGPSQAGPRHRRTPGRARGHLRRPRQRLRRAAAAPRRSCPPRAGPRRRAGRAGRRRAAQPGGRDPAGRGPGQRGQGRRGRCRQRQGRRDHARRVGNLARETLPEGSVGAMAACRSRSRRSRRRLRRPASRAGQITGCRTTRCATWPACAPRPRPSSPTLVAVARRRSPTSRCRPSEPSPRPSAARNAAARPRPRSTRCVARRPPQPAQVEAKKAAERRPGWTAAGRVRAGCRPCSRPGPSRRAARPRGGRRPRARRPSARVRPGRRPAAAASSAMPVNGAGCPSRVRLRLPPDPALLAAARRHRLRRRAAPRCTPPPTATWSAPAGAAAATATASSSTTACTAAPTWPPPTTTSPRSSRQRARQPGPADRLLRHDRPVHRVPPALRDPPERRPGQPAHLVLTGNAVAAPRCR